MLADTTYEHIQLDDRGVPVISGTTMKVQELVAERLAWGWSPEELLLNHPELTLGQVFSALAYYADHQAAMDEAIAREVQEIDELRARSEPSPLVARLKVQGLL